MFYGAPAGEDHRAIPDAAAGKDYREPARGQDPGVTLLIQQRAGYGSSRQCGVRLARLMQERGVMYGNCIRTFGRFADPVT